MSILFLDQKKVVPPSKAKQNMPDPHQYETWLP